MDAHPAWQWNEVQQVGTDYTDILEVEHYDRRMGQLRDLPAEDAAVLSELALPKGARILEVGTGTGHFARAAAKAGHGVTAIDVSPVMLQYAVACARAEGVDIEFLHAGFLTFSCEPGAFDAAVSVMALHHLPDLWKAVALHNINRALRSGGRFLLRDVVFHGCEEDHRACFDGFISACPEGMRTEAARHVAREFSTTDWIMHGLLTRAGFRILSTGGDRASVIQYLCEKRSS